MMNDVSRLLAQTGRTIGRDPAAAAIVLILLTGLGIAGDMAPPDAAVLALFGTSIASFAAQYILTRRVMRRDGLLMAGVSGAVAAMFGLGIVSNLAIGLGFLLLLVPGWWLLARWIAAVPVLFAEEPGVMAALDISAARMRPMIPAAMVAILIVYLPFAVAMVLSVLEEVEQVATSAATSALANLAISASQVGAWYLAVAAYRLTLPEPIDAVFD